MANTMDTEKSCYRTINLLGVEFEPYSRDRVLDEVCRAVRRRDRITVVSGNVHGFHQAYKYDWLRAFFNSADILRLDGAGVRLGAFLLGHKTPPRMTWADFAWDLAARCAEKGHNLFFLGARDGVAEKAANRLTDRHPDLEIIGTHHGYFNKEAASPENERVIQMVNRSRPDMLLVGFGMPKQERWLLHARERLEVPVVFTVGAAFDYVAGELRRGPKFMTENGLEWLARLMIEPRRLWRRYIFGNPLFVWRVLKQRLLRE